MKDKLFVKKDAVPNLSPDEQSGFSQPLSSNIPEGGRITSLLGTRLARTFTGHTHFISSISFSPDGHLALSGSFDMTARLWETATGRCIHVFSHKNTVLAVAFSPDGRLALTGTHKLDVASKDSTLFLWDVTSGHLVKELGQDSITSLSFSPDGHLLLCAQMGQHVQLWDFVTQKALPSFDKDLCVHVAVFSPDGKSVLFGCQGIRTNSAQLWSAETRKQIRTFEGYNGWINAVLFSSDGELAIAGCYDGAVRIWDVTTGKLRLLLSGHEKPVTAVSVASDRSYLLSGSEDGTGRLWNCKTGECLYKFEKHKKTVRAVEFSPDMKYMLSGSDDATLQFWEFSWKYDFPAPLDWDEGAKPYIEMFLLQQTPRLGSSEKLMRTLTFRRNKPVWNEEDFQILINQLKKVGYGWLRPEGVRRKVEELAAQR